MITKKDLVQYIDIQEEIKELDNKIAKTKEEIKRIENDGVVIDIVSGGNGGNQHFKVEGFPHPIYTKKKNLLYMQRSKQESLRIKLENAKNEIEEFITTIEDSQIRRIVNLRFIEKLSWRQVAVKIGGRNTEDSVRMIFNRFMKSKGAN